VVQAHYMAPATVLLVALIVESARHLRVWWRHARFSGRVILWLAVLLCVAQVLPRIARDPRKKTDWSLRRARLLTKLEHEEGRHLVIVHYAPGHHPYHEWVFNRADVDGAKVVWARDKGPEQNRALTEYFKNRHIWLLDADKPGIQLRPYSAPSDAPAGSARN
jgi:hypothetical protein